MNDGIKNLLSSFKRKKGIALLLVLGVALLLLSAFIPSGSDKAESESRTLSEYKEELQTKVEELCSSVEGVGKCKVMISFSEGESFEYKGSTLIGSAPPRVLGVVIVCEGGDSDYVKAALTDAVCALFDIGKNRVAVMPLE